VGAVRVDGRQYVLDAETGAGAAGDHRDRPALASLALELRVRGPRPSMTRSNRCSTVAQTQVIFVSGQAP
jgi:hypothetical protein